MRAIKYLKRIVFISILATSLFLVSCAKHYDILMDTKPCLEPFHENHFVLCRDYKVIVDEEDVVVPKGFVTDLASIPRIIYPFFSPNDSYSIGPAILHDWMYREDVRFNRRESDDIFYYALLKNGTATPQAFMFYQAVRWFGESSFITKQ